MKLNKKILQMAITAAVILFNSWCCSANNTFSLKNSQLAFDITTTKNGPITLNYSLNGKIFPAVTLQLKIKNATGDYHYSVTHSSSGNQQGTLNIVTADGQHGSLQFNFGTPENYLKLANFNNISKLQINFNSMALVLPDQRSEDLVIYPSEWSGNHLSIPADNHLIINMLNHGNAILSCLWNSAKINLTVLKSTNGKRFSGLALIPERDDNIWLGLNAGNKVWSSTAIKLGYRPAVIGWTPPFNAIWRVTIKKGVSKLTAENNQCDSWNLADLGANRVKSGRAGVGIQSSDGKTWSSSLGSYLYPFSIKNGKVALHFPKYNSHRMTYNKKFSPLIYPVEALPKQASSQLLPYDALAKILAPEALTMLVNVRSKQSNYPATCGITAKVEKIFYRDEEKQSKQIIKKHFKRMNMFVLNNRIRIDEYRTWSKKLAQQLEIYGKQHPKATALTKSLRKDLYQIQLHYAAVYDKIKKPPYCKILTDKVEQLIDSNKDAETKEDASKEFGRQIRIIGGKQDHLVADMHYIVKALRMRVTIALLKNPPTAQRQILETVRLKTAQIMHVRFPMEGK